ncbi:MAG TPA: right-handed parallel beta-helix repeat-containing protein, partial [Blastocatellia bacterium]|nr:right-handed parallel beta-helix repeat-containing protein [Blastocatellia bacterium]
MKLLRLAAAYIGIHIAFALTVSAQTTLHSTYVSTCGDDGNVCSATAPCRTLQAAINAVAPGGAVFVANGGNYGTSTLTINKSVTVESSGGATALLTIGSGDGIDINAGTGGVVGLRGLAVTYQGAPAGGYQGIFLNGGSNLTVEDCVINGFPGNGILLNSAGQALVRNTSVRNNLGVGIVSYAFASIEKVVLQANAAGIIAREGSKVSVRDS